MDFSYIEKAIVTVKGQKVIIDSDVAKIYGVETREINQAVKNNLEKFPSGYIIEADKDELIKNFDKFKNIKNYPGSQRAFTELRQTPAFKSVHLPPGFTALFTFPEI